MNDLISRREAIRAIDDLPNCYNGYSDTYDKACIIGVLEELPTIDHVKHTCEYWDSESSFCTLNKPSDVKHGKWIKDGGETYALYKCSACNDLCTVAGWANCIPEEHMYKTFKFCPNCGARMDL